MLCSACSVVGFGLGLGEVKQLARNSIVFSKLEEGEGGENDGSLERWERKWDEWVEEILE